MKGQIKVVQVRELEELQGWYLRSKINKENYCFEKTTKQNNLAVKKDEAIFYNNIYLYCSAIFS